MTVIPDHRLDRFCWMIVNSRNHWWPPEEVAADIAAGVGDESDSVVASEEAYALANFAAYDDVVEDLGVALAGDMLPEESYSEWVRRCVRAVERRAERYVENNEGLLPEKTREEIHEEMRQRKDTGEEG